MITSLPVTSRRSFLASLVSASAALSGLSPAGGAMRSSRQDQRFESGPLTAAVVDGPHHVLAASERTLWRLEWPSLQVVMKQAIDLDKINAIQLVGADSGWGETRIWLAGGTPGESGGIVGCRQDGGTMTRLTAGDDVLRCLSHDRERDVLRAGSHAGTVYQWLSPSAQPEEFTGHSGPITGLLAFDQASWVSASLDGSLRVWSATDNAPRRVLQQHADGVERVMAIGPSAGGLAQCVSLGRDRTLRLWQPSIGRQVRFARLQSAGKLLAPGRTADEILTGGNEGRIEVVNLVNVKTALSQPFGPGPMTCLGTTPHADEWWAAGRNWIRRITANDLPDV